MNNILQIMMVVEMEKKQTCRSSRRHGRIRKVNFLPSQTLCPTENPSFAACLYFRFHVIKIFLEKQLWCLKGVWKRLLMAVMALKQLNHVRTGDKCDYLTSCRCLPV